MASIPSTTEFAPLKPLTNHARFSWQRFEFACEQICHGNAAAAVETCYDLLLEPRLPIYLRSTINATLAMVATHRTPTDRTRFLNEAKRTFELVKTYKRTEDSDEENARLEDSIRHAEKEIEEAEAKLDAGDYDEDDDVTDSEEESGGEVGDDEAENASFQDAVESLPNVMTNIKLESPDVEMKDASSDIESELGVLPATQGHKTLASGYLATPEPSSDINNGHGKGQSGGNGNGNGNGASGSDSSGNGIV